MVNKIWGWFIIIGIVFSVFFGKVAGINNEIIAVCKTSLDMLFKILPMIVVWMGIMNIAQTSGLLSKISKLTSPVLGKLFPEIPKGHESLAFISSNVIVNMFGLGNAATPFGLKAMRSLQELNPKKDTASRSMITFLVLNTSGMTLIPTTVISLRAMYGSSNPTRIIVPAILATMVATIGGLLMDRILSGCVKS